MRKPDKMKKKKDLYFYFLGIVALIPFNIFIVDTQIFLLQQIIFSCLIIYKFSSSTKIIWGSTIDKIFLAYFIWGIFSFLLNLPITTDETALLRKSFSLIMFISLSLTFLVGKSYSFNNKTAIIDFTQGIIITYLLISLYFMAILIIKGAEDLMLVREEIGQRLPFVIAYVATLAIVITYFEYRKSIIFIFTGIIGITTVILSLTRAAYLQLLVSYFFLILFGGKTIKRILIMLIPIILIIILGFGLLNLDIPAIDQIFQRIELLSDIEQQREVDPSGSTRLFIWELILQKFEQFPHAWLLGFGQLGPTELTKGMSESSSAHNQYLDVLVREGAVGLTMFLTLFFLSIRYGIKNINISSQSVSSKYFFANSIALLGIMVYSFFHETVRYPMFGFYLWFYLGLISSKNESMLASE